MSKKSGKQKRKRKGKRGSVTQVASWKYYPLAILVMLGMAVGVGVAGIARLSTVDIPLTSQWQVATGLRYVTHNGIDLVNIDSAPMTNDSFFGSYNSEYKLLDADSYTWTYINGQPVPVKDSWARYLGSPKMRVELGLPVHVTRTRGLGGWSDWYEADDQVPYRTYTKTVDNYTFSWDHHVYLVDVTMTTEGEVLMVRPNWIDGHEWVGTTEGLVRTKEAHLRVFLEFGVPMWGIHVGDVWRANQTEYVVDQTWAGVMSSTVAYIDLGTVSGSPTETTFGGRVIAGNTVGNPVNMWDAGDGSLFAGFSNIADSIDSAELGAIMDVPQSVVFEVSGTLQPGCLVQYGGVFNDRWDAIDVVDRYLQPTLRIDVLFAHRSYAISGDQPTVSTPTGTNPTDNPPSPGIQLPFFFDPLGFFLVTVSIVGVIIVILFAIWIARKAAGV